MSQKSITDLNINSITLSNSNYASTEGYTTQSSTLLTSNSGVLLVNGVPISSGGGGDVDAIDAGFGISVSESPTGTFTITNDGVLEVASGDGISIVETPSGSGIFEITNTVNTDNFLTQSSAAATYQSQANMASYSTTAEANGLYLNAASLNPYSTTTQANTLYQPIGDSFITVGTIASVRNEIPINNGAQGYFASEKVSLVNFTGSINSTYFITINNASEFPLSATCAFDSLNGTTTIINCSFFYNSSTDYSGGFLNISFSVLGMKL